jgi:hypothetical protein
MELNKNNIVHLTNKCGIYELIINKKSYIGSSINLKNKDTQEIIKTFENAKVAAMCLKKNIKAIYDLIYRKTKIEKLYILTY